MNKFRNALIQKSYTFYTKYLKQTRIGKFFAQKVIRFGLIERTDVQVARLTAPISITSKTSNSDHNLSQVFNNSLYSQELDSVQLPNFHLSPPLNFQVSEELSTASYINVLLPSLQVKHMSGGPNTALLFAALLAESGEYIRLISCDVSADGEEEKLYSHMDSLLRRSIAREKIELVDAFDRSKIVNIGINDIFFATAWWTAQIAKYGIEHTVYRSFVYLIQDFEPILHEGSTFYARALETYALSHIPLVNTKLLLDHLIYEKAGCYSNQNFADNALTFEPAIDRNYYFPDVSISTSSKKVLLFYARPTMARRNLFEIGIVALRNAVAAGAITDENWEVWAMGEKLPTIPLGNGVDLKPLPWLSFEDYAKRVRTADLLLSLMLSPHPSYPPLEMAASGKLVVTNSFSVKTCQRLKKLSNNIIIADPTPQSIGIALEKAIRHINSGLPSYDPCGSIDLPQTWEESLSKIIPELLAKINTLRSTPPGISKLSLMQGQPYYPKSSYEIYKKNRLEHRRNAETYRQEIGLLSFITSAYNTPAKFLLDLGNSIFIQDGGLNFEWLILDNGSTHKDTLDALQSLTRYPNVRLERVEKNLGIIGGMRYLLENAHGRYILPLDSDDLVEPDCVNVITRYIQKNQYPEILYTDEDKVENQIFKDPYFKPDWDPVLFLHSCYIAHLCIINRQKALDLQLYSDESAEGCHDWDSFIRFMNAGYVPCHIPEVLYSWRIHTGSTSGNISSKSYITDSHRSTLQRFLDFRKLCNIELTYHPLFQHNVDWWFKRKRNTSISCETIILSSSLSNVIDLLQQISKLDCDLINLRWEGITPENNEWLWESSALFEIFPDTVMVGGPIYDGKSLIGGFSVFGFGQGCDCPDVGRSIKDPGYFAWLFKTHSVASVSTGHCVVHRSFLMQALKDQDLIGEPVFILGPWLGALAAENGQRVVFTPFIRSQGSWVPENNVPRTTHQLFLSRFWQLIVNSRLYSPRLGLTNQSAYSHVCEIERVEHLKSLQAQTLSYPQWLQWQIRQRSVKYPAIESPVTISLVTSIYEKTSFPFLEELANSIANQTIHPWEWVIVAHGSVDVHQLDNFQKNFSKKLNIRLFTNSQPLGIIGAMDLALTNAQGDYIIPIDADDLLTHDALHILLHYVHRYDQPDLLYSDEDLLVDNQFSHPYFRAEFDPVLNLESSYIWHLCAIKRSTAIQLNLYKDQKATWCHDWNTVFKLLGSQSQIRHIPEILYHWRQHKGSTTNNSSDNSYSLLSVKHILESQISQLPNSSKYHVAPWPSYRGAPELYIKRKMEDLPRFIFANDYYQDTLDHANTNSIIVFTLKNVVIDPSVVYPEVVRLFELHEQIGAIGGITVGKNNQQIVDACYVTNDRGCLESPWLGQSEHYSGPYSLALKPQTVASTGRTLAFFKVSALKQSICWPLMSDQFSLFTTIDICQRLREYHWQTCFSPLVIARSSVNVDPIPTDHVIDDNIVMKSHMFARYGLTRNFRLD